MIPALTQIGLITTVLFSIVISFVISKNRVGSEVVGKCWIAFNISLGLWSFFWCTGAFYLKVEEHRWFSIYFASLCAIPLPPLFVCFVFALLDRAIAGSKLIKFAWIMSISLIVACIVFPRSFFIPGVRGLLPTGGILLWAFLVQYLFLMNIGNFLLIQGLRGAKPSQRNKIWYVLLGIGIGSGGGVHAFLPPLGITSSYPYGVILVPVYSLLITYAISRHQLMDITIVVRRTLIYSTVMGTLAGIYLTTVAIFTHLFEGLAGAQTVFSSAVAAGLITIAFQPLRKRVQAFVDSKFFRQYVDRDEKLYELSREVITHTTPEAMGGVLMRVLGETLHPKSGGLYLRSREGSGFVKVSGIGQMDLNNMTEDNPLASYFRDHTQPFVQDLPADTGESKSTRRDEGRGEAA